MKVGWRWACGLLLLPVVTGCNGTVDNPFAARFENPFDAEPLALFAPPNCAIQPPGDDFQILPVTASDEPLINWTGCDKSGVDLSDKDLSGAVLVAADFRAADLRGADLGGANLSRANLRGADLRGANLVGAYVEGASFAEANLTGAVATAVKWSGVDLAGARWNAGDGICAEGSIGACRP